MRQFRLLAFLLVLIWLIPAPTILGHTASGDSVIFGLYTPRYLMIVAGYIGSFLAISLVALFAKPGFWQSIKKAVNWVQRYPWIIFLLAYGLMELWYFIRAAFKERRLFFSDDWVVRTGLVDDRELYVISLFLALVFLYLILVLLFAGRDRESLRETLMGTAVFAVSGLIAFFLFAYGYTLIVARQSYLTQHSLWAVPVVNDPTFGYRLKPNLDMQIYLEDEERFTSPHTDSQGFRNQIDTQEAVIAGIGDSYIFGAGVEDQEVWSYPLSDALGGIPVANYGVYGYSLWQYNLVAEHFVSQTNPKIVFYTIFANDLRDEAVIQRDIRVLQYWQLRPYRSPIHYTLFNFMSESPIHRVINAIKTGRVNDTPPEDIAPDRPFYLPSLCIPNAQAHNPEAFYRLVDEAISLADKNNYTLLFVTLPTKESAYIEYYEEVCDSAGMKSLITEQSVYENICNYLQARSRHCYNLTADMRAAARSEDVPLYLPLDSHLSPEGHRVFAALLADYINEHGLLEQ